MDEERLLDAACKLGLRLQEIKARSERLAEFPGAGNQKWEKRQEVGGVLRAVTDFVNTVPEWRETSAPLEELVRVFTNIERGRAVPNWLDDPSIRRRADPIEIEWLRGSIAAIMERLHGPDFTREAAANFIKDHLPEDSFARLLPTSAHNKWTWRTVAQWRDSVIGSAPPSPRRTFYELTLLLLPTEADPQDRAKELLSIVAHTLATTSE